MTENELKVFSDLVSKKTNSNVVFIDVEQIGSGYHSDGFKLTSEDGRLFFLKYIKSHDLGFEFPERQVMNLMVSNGMGERSVGKNPNPVGVVVKNNNESVMLPYVDDSTKMYHIQEFRNIGKSYSSILEVNSNKASTDEEDRKQLSVIADSLIKIHSIKHNSTNKDRLNAIYNDGIRNVLTHPELSVMVLSEFPEDYKILDLKSQQEIISLMYENIKKWIGRGDRLTALHGDFWGANIFLNSEGDVSLIDFSRIPWGDPAIDVGWFLAEYLWKYHETGNIYFKELTEMWLDVYQEKSGDKDLRKAIPLAIGWIGIVRVYPRWFPNIDVETGKKFINHIIKILKHHEFIWEN